MSIKELAKLIPAEYRREILQLDMISRANAQGSDPSMLHLAVVWKNYIEPDFEGGCPLCYSRVLTTFRSMQDDLIELERNENLLNQA